MAELLLRSALDQKVEDRLQGIENQFSTPSILDLPTVDFPIFDGSNPKIWVMKCENYFALQPSMSDIQRIDLAIWEFEGRAFSWISDFTIGEIFGFTWKQFCEVVCTRFDVLDISKDEDALTVEIEIEVGEKGVKHFPVKDVEHETVEFELKKMVPYETTGALLHALWKRVFSELPSVMAFVLGRSSNVSSVDSKFQKIDSSAYLSSSTYMPILLKELGHVTNWDPGDSIVVANSSVFLTGNFRWKSKLDGVRCLHWRNVFQLMILDPDDVRMELQARKQREAVLEAALAETETLEDEYRKKVEEAKRREAALEIDLVNMWVLVEVGSHVKELKEGRKVFSANAAVQNMMCCSILVAVQKYLYLLLVMSGTLLGGTDVLPSPLETNKRFPFGDVNKDTVPEENKEGRKELKADERLDNSKCLKVEYTGSVPSTDKSSPDDVSSEDVKKWWKDQNDCLIPSVLTSPKSCTSDGIDHLEEETGMEASLPMRDGSISEEVTYNQFDDKVLDSPQAHNYADLVAPIGSPFVADFGCERNGLNMGSHCILETLRNTQDNKDAAYDAMNRQVVELARQTFIPEFMNRIDEYIVFQPLDSNQISKIVEIQLGRVRSRFKQNEDSGGGLHIEGPSTMFGSVLSYVTLIEVAGGNGSFGTVHRAEWHRSDVVVKVLMKLIVCAEINKVIGIHMCREEAADLVQGFAITVEADTKVAVSVDDRLEYCKFSFLDPRGRGSHQRGVMSWPTLA